LLYRAFYALPQSIATTSGCPTNALYGFTSMVLKLLGDDERSRDRGRVGCRQAAVPDGGFPGVQANRSTMPEELKAQLDHLDEIWKL
jgi:DNA polymerase-1